MCIDAALAFAIVGVSSFVTPVSAAKPGNVPPPPGTGEETAQCASSFQSQAARNCHFEPGA